MIQHEIKLLNNRKVLIPLLVLFLALSFLAFVNYWSGAEQKQLTGENLASFLIIRACQSVTLALFFLIWMLQYSIHLLNSGFYRMLLSFGLQRKQLFVYAALQVVFYAVLLMVCNFLAYALLSFFYGINPLSLLVNADINALLAQFFYLFAIGLAGICIAFARANYTLLLPVLVYWLLEGWINSLIERKLEIEIGQFFPLQSLRQIISENFLNMQQSIGILAYFALFAFLLHFLIQQKSFV